MKKGIGVLCLFMLTTALSAQVSGFAFEDFNFDGVRDAGEVPFPNVTVTAYDANGTVIANGVTGPDGSYSFPGVSVPVRIEFSDLPAFAEATSGIGTTNGSAIQFAVPGDTNINYGVQVPDEYCQDRMELAIPCYVTGSSDDPDSETVDALVVVPFTATDEGADPPVEIGSSGEVGATWGTAYNQNREKLYSATMLKRHAGFGPDGIGGIYVNDVSTIAGSTPMSFYTVTNVTDLNDPTRPDLMGPTDPSLEAEVYEKVGKFGLGDIEYDPVRNALYVVVLEPRQLVRLDLSTDGMSVLSETVIPLPTEAFACDNGEFRPWGLKYYRDKVFLGGICDGSAGGTRDDLDWSVYEYDAVTQSWNTTPLVTGTANQGIDQVHGYGTAEPNCGNFNTWTEDYTLYSFYDGGDAFCYPQPILSDIEIANDGSMQIAFMDRLGHQSGPGNVLPGDPNGEFRLSGGQIAGVIQYAQYDRTTMTFALESGGTVTDNEGNTLGAGENSDADNFGTGDPQFYNGLNFSYVAPTASRNGRGHGETGVGGMVQKRGSNELMTVGMDPERVYSGGLYWLDNTDGSKTRTYELFRNDDGGGRPNDIGSFSKANGLGEPELICSPAPIEIGNFVWLDTDRDGIQDPGEMPLEGVNVSLYDAAGNQIATTVTDANGAYYFNSNTTAGLLPETDYFVVVGEGQVTDEMLMLGGQEYDLTIPLATTALAQDSIRDSDGMIAAGTGFAFDGLPFTAVTTGAAGTVDHTLDFGFIIPPDYDLALRKTLVTTGAVGPGDVVTFAIEVFNQGDTTAYNIDVTDYIPSGTSFVNLTAGITTTDTRMVAATITDNGGGMATIDSLSAMDAVTYEITLMLSNPFTGSTPILNFAEITAFEDGNGDQPEDIDSTPDDNPTNDPGGAFNTGSDNAIDGDGLNGGGAPGDVDPLTDEDDADVAAVSFMDLALIKVIDPSAVDPVTGTVMTSMPIPFNITVFNQGGVDAYDVDIIDYTPCGLDFDSVNPDNIAAGWTADGANARLTIPGPIPVGGSATVTIWLDVSPTAGGCLEMDPFINIAEITDQTDAPGGVSVNDIDSSSDDNPADDAGGAPNMNSDNAIDGDGTGNPGDTDPLTDEDDSDVANLMFLDLALTKVIDEASTPGPFAIGSEVKFDIEITNQGNVPLLEVDINDYLPEGLEFNANAGNAIWDYDNATRIATTTIDLRPLPGLGFGETTTVSIYATVIATADLTNPNFYTNVAEIGEAVGAVDNGAGPMEVTFTQDDDSRFDAIDNNDAGGAVGTPSDDVVDGNGTGEVNAMDPETDEDDSDPALVEIIGLSLGSTVFEDLNNDGEQNPGEDGIGELTVSLFQDGGDGIPGSPDDIAIATTMTSPSGDYLFENLAPGDYFVTVSAPPADLPISSNTTSGSFAGETDPDDNVDNDDEGMQPNGSGTAVNSGIVTLATGAEPTAADGETAQGSGQDGVNDLQDENGNMTLDFGFFAPVTVGDTAFVDLDGNGVQDDGDSPLAGVEVTIIDEATGEPVALDAEGNPYNSMLTTDADGRYLFENLPPGSYSVIFDITNTLNGEFFIYTTPNIGDDTNDSDVVTVNPDDRSGSTAPTGFLSSGESDLTLDAGVVCNVSATVPEPFSVCSTDSIDLTLGGSISPSSLSGFWVSSGDGTFDDILGFFGSATAYIPGPEDISNGSVTLTLQTVTPPAATGCEPVSAEVIVTILKVDCGTFPWGGN